MLTYYYKLKIMEADDVVHVVDAITKLFQNNMGKLFLS